MFNFIQCFFLSLVLALSCGDVPASNQVTNDNRVLVHSPTTPRPAAYDTLTYLPMLKGKRVGLLTNHSALVKNEHLLDILLRHHIDVQAIWTPEHGFKGTAAAGAHINDGEHLDIPIHSLYGKTKKPTASDLEGIDIMLMDIQDVGVRFYTYTSTMHYALQACAEQQVPFMVLDRPNPNGWYVDGNILDPAYASFVGMHPVPIVHGMTIGEYAQMINGEEWLKDNITSDLTIIPCTDYTHNTRYALPVPPSPNLPNDAAISWYPSLCLFEGTTVSVGRGTDHPFQCYGHPKLSFHSFAFTPQSTSAAPHPKFEKTTCFGVYLNEPNNEGAINISFLLNAYEALNQQGEEYFLTNGFFDKLAGGQVLRQQIEAGKSADEISASWQEGLTAFRQMRAKYLIYP